jgi:hypothetical protein
MGVLRTLLAYYRFEEELPFTKEQVLKIIHASSYACYLLYQSKFRDEKNNEDDEIRIKEYLKQITQVVMEDEVEDIIAIYPHGADGGIVILDTDLDHPNNTPIYFL